MFSAFDSFADINRRESRLIRENTIASMRMAANRVSYAAELEGGNPGWGTIQEICPSFSPRQCAMVRSIIVNNGVVDDNPIDWD